MNTHINSVPPTGENMGQAPAAIASSVLGDDHVTNDMHDGNDSESNVGNDNAAADAPEDESERKLSAKDINICKKEILQARIRRGQV